MQSLTHHARARMQQRGIRPEAIAALLDFGCARHLHSKGRELVFFDKRHHRRPPLPARDASLAMALPLDFLVAISPFVVLFILWVLED